VVVLLVRRSAAAEEVVEARPLPERWMRPVVA
jgi:hypothetical protein